MPTASTLPLLSRAVRVRSLRPPGGDHRLADVSPGRPPQPPARPAPLPSALCPLPSVADRLMGALVCHMVLAMTEREAGPAGCFSVDTRLQQVGELFASYPGSWWIAGGWAVDLHVGRVRRAHADVDVLVLARELEQFSDAFADRGLVVTDRRTGERRPWAYPQEVEPGRETLGLADGPPGLEVLVGAAEGADWVFHRGRRSRRPLAELTRRGPGGLPYLSPRGGAAVQGPGWPGQGRTGLPRPGSAAHR
ncbi:hypothetical protein P3T34_001032 [Kitasatospora sp. MAP12-44]|nr:hypothetical protein [Kitasatospora sp. MAP12-44]